MALPQTEKQARLVADSILAMMRDEQASGEFLDLINGRTTFARLMFAPPADKVPMVFPVHVRRIIADPLRGIREVTINPQDFYVDFAPEPPVSNGLLATIMRWLRR